MYNVIKTEELKAIAEVNAMNTHAENARLLNKRMMLSGLGRQVQF